MPLTPCTAESLRLVGRVSGAFFTSAGASGGVDSAREERLRQAVWRLRRSFATLSSGGLDRQLVELVRAFGARIDHLEAAVVAWVDVVEILVQEMESQQGRAAGSGHEKKAKVQAALFNLMLEMSQRDGRRTSPFAPLLFEAIADWSVDAVVLLLNRHDLWQPAPRPASGWLRRLAAAFFRLVLAPFRRLRDLAVTVVSRVVTARNPISPELAAAISRIPSSGSLAGLLEDGLGFLTWVGRHRDQVVAMVDIVSITVHEAEALIELSGPEKKAYARDLIVIFLQEEGVFPPPGSPFSPLIEGMVGGTIEAVVTLFKKRNLFPSRTGSAPSP